jgi:prepilin-type N-terminal cleavage/methylation domain-containing protein
MGARPQRNSQMEYLTPNDQLSKDNGHPPADGSHSALRASRRVLRNSRRALRDSRRAMEASLAKRAFSLIELVGVLAVLVILATAAAPVIIKQIDIAAYNAESASLTAISDAFIQHIVRSNNIPNQNSWVQAVTAELPVAQTNIAATPRRWDRAYLIDPGGWLAGALGSGSWNQSAGGITSPATNARVMIISTLARGLPVSGGMASSAQAFQDIWNTPPRGLPNNSTWTSWGGQGDDLLIQRINLQPLFHRVILVNGYVGGQGYFSINGSAAAAVPYGGSGTNTYYLDGTILGLYSTNQSGLNLMAKEIIKSDMSRVFEYGIWRDQLSGGVTNGFLTGLSSVAASFFTNSAPPSGLSWGGTPQVVLGLMNAYMNGYMTWASMSPCFGYFGSGNPNAANFPGYNEINDAINSFSKGGNIVP